MRRHIGCLFPAYLLNAASNGSGITGEAYSANASAAPGLLPDPGAGLAAGM